MDKKFLAALDLGGGVTLPAEIAEAILAEHGKTAGALATERDALKASLGEANAAIKSYTDMDIDGIKAKTAEWEAKYTADTQALRDKLAETEYGYAVKNAVSGLKFSSQSAAKAFAAEVAAKKLRLEDGKLLGLDDVVKGYRESDPAAFADEDDGKTPVFVRGSTAGGGSAASSAALRSAFGLTDKN